MAQKITKANGHIVQADWLQTDPSKMDYIHNKPDAGLSEDQVVETVFGMGKYTPDLNFVFDTTTRTWNRNPIGVYYGTNFINFANEAETYGCPPITLSWWVVKGEEISVSPEGYPTYLKQTLIVGAMERIWERYWSPDYSNQWSKWRTTMQWPGEMYFPNTTGISPDTLVGFGYYTESGGLKPINYMIGSSSGNIPIRTKQGDLVVPQNPETSDMAASKGYVDRLNKKKRTTIEVMETFKLGDLHCYKYASNIVTYIEFETVNGQGLSHELEGDYEITIMSINNLPSEIFNDQCGIFIQPVGMGATSAYLQKIAERPVGGTWTTALPYSYYTFPSGIDEQILIDIGLDKEGYLTTEEDTERLYEYAKDIEITVRYTPKGVNAENPITDILNADLYSDTELEYQIPITELSINNFISCEGHLDEWTIIFVAGDEDPLIFIPSNVKYMNAQPIFEANRRYILTFKKMYDNYYCIWSVIE